MCRLVDPALKYEWDQLNSTDKSEGKCVRHRLCLLDGCAECAHAMVVYLASLQPNVYDLYRSVLDGTATEMGGGASSASGEFDEGAYLAWRYGRYRERHPECAPTPMPIFYDRDGHLIYCLRCGNTSGSQCNCYDADIGLVGSQASEA